MRQIRPVKFIKPLIECLKIENEPGIHSLAANSLMNIVDINSDLSEFIVRDGIEIISS